MVYIKSIYTQLYLQVHTIIHFDKAMIIQENGKNGQKANWILAITFRRCIIPWQYLKYVNLILLKTSSTTIFGFCVFPDFHLTYPQLSIQGQSIKTLTASEIRIKKIKKFP